MLSLFGLKSAMVAFQVIITTYATEQMDHMPVVGLNGLNMFIDI